jgi:hypothetical protein
MGLDHGEKKTARYFVSLGAGHLKSAGDAPDLEFGQFISQTNAFRGQVKASLAQVGWSWALRDEAFFPEILENTGETLLGDFQDIQQFGNFQTGVAVHEVQDAVVSAPEPVPFQNRVGIAGEVAVGKIEQLHKADERRRHGRGGAVRGRIGARGSQCTALSAILCSYVSHVDLFAVDR